MKRLLLVLAFAVSTPAWAAIAFVPASHTMCSQSSASAGAACTLNGPTTAGNLVIAGLTWKTASQSINDVEGSAPGSWFFPYAQVCNGTGSCSAILICRDCAALTTVTPRFTGSTSWNLSVEEYSGVAAIGVTRTATGNSTAPGVTVTTGDPNDWLVAVTSSLGSSGVPTAGAGNLRDAARTGTTSSYVAAAACDNLAASAGSLSCATTITSGAWSAVGVELRTTYLTTYIWPDCDASHPCVIHEKDTVALGTGTDTLTGPFRITVPPTLPGNLMKLTISHPSTAAISSITDDQSNTWSAGATTTDTNLAETTEVRYVCGANTGTSVITVGFSNAIVDGDVAQFSYDEVSGIAATSCGDGNSGSSGGQGVLNPGPLTTTSSGDMIFTFGICTSDSTENGNQAGVAMPDDTSAKIAENDFDQFMSMVEVQVSSGAINPTIYADAMDVNNNNWMFWNIVSQAFRASSGAGTQPSGIHVVTDQHFINWNVLGWDPLPSNGNAIVFSTSNPSSGWGMTNLTDNYGTTYTRTPYTDPTVDPQQYSACLGSNVSARDRIFSYTPDVVQTHVEIYTIAGAKNALGTACVGTTVNHSAGTQAATANDNIVGDPVITPTINAGAKSAIFATSYVGTGPPSGMCISGGVTPPTCTGQSAGVIFNSIYAKGMTDQSSWSTGDPYAFFYTNSTSPRSMDYLMANGTAATSYYGAAIEILGSAAVFTPVVTVAPSASDITLVQALSVAVTVSGGTGNPTPTGAVTLTGGGYTSAATTLSSGSATLSIPAGSLAIGSDTLTVSYTPDSQSASTYSPATGTYSAVTVAQALPTVSAWPAASSITSGLTLASSTLTGGTASVPGIFVWTTPGLVPGQGTSSQSVTFTPTDAIDYSTVTGQVSVTVNNATTPTVSAWPTSSPITYGQTLASSTLTGGTASVAGAFAWTAPATVPATGIPSESVTFTPSDTTDYNTATGLVIVTVSKATPTVSVWPTASSITYGQTLTSSNLTGGAASVPGAFTWTTPSTAPATGTSSQNVTFTPADATDYNAVPGQSSVMVNKATPTVSAWPTSSAISYGQTLASSTLIGGTASVPGTFAWATPGTAPATGTSSQSVTFSPIDTTDYNTAPGQLNITVNKAAPTVSAWPTASAITYGQTLTSSILAGGTASVAGAFAWTAPGTAPGAGMPSESVTFTPTDTNDYSSPTQLVPLIVNKAILTVTAANASVRYNQSIPQLTYSIAGYVNGDKSSVVSGAPAETTTASINSPVGTYPITISQGTLAASNYTFLFQNATLTITTLGTTATPAFKPAAGAYTSVQSVSITDTTTGAAIYYTTDGSVPSTSSTPYSVAITVSSTQTIRAIAIAPGYAQSTVASATYTITLPTATPVFTPAAGTYTGAQTVTIADATPGAIIYYTTNGTTPTTSSSQYPPVGIRVPATETIKAIAVATGYSQSAVASAAYTIATAPSVTTKAASALNTSSATLNGSVTANDATTRYWFAYGTSGTALTGKTTATGALTGKTATSVSATLTGLKANTTYYFQVVASNAVGTASGAVLSFTTR